MITNNTGYTIQRLRGLAADTKPLDVPNGSEYLEMDTGDKYLFDAAGSTWIKQGNGSGGGDSSVVMYNVQYDATNNNYTIPATAPELITIMESGKLLLLNIPHNAYPGGKYLEPVISIEVQSENVEEYSVNIRTHDFTFAAYSPNGYPEAAA